MKQKTYTILLAVIAALGLLATVLHIVYAANAYEHASIIEFIAREVWW